jgi:hypothetical protein
MPMKPDQSQSSLKISRYTLTLTRTLIISHCKSFWGRRKLATLKVQNIKKTPQMFCFFKILYRGPFWEFKWQMVNSNHIFLRVVITSPWPLNVFSSISLCWLLLLNFFLFSFSRIGRRRRRRTGIHNCQQTCSLPYPALALGKNRICWFSSKSRQ